MDALVARGLDVYAIDLRGYGGTPRDSSGWLTPSRAAADVRAVLDWIHAQSSAKEKPVLFGWSRGSLVSQLVAEKYPEALSALILFGRPAQDTLFPGGPPVGISAPRVANTTAAAKTDFITPGSISRGAMDTYVQAALTADPVHAEWRNLDEFNGLDDARVRVPTLLVIGEFDPFYSRQQKRQAERFVGLGTADKEWVILAGSDHAALIERAAPRLVQAIVSFLDRPRF
jgi:pimeloyl-ACP methyl ester carboxylesterase